jgi:hypothetical protein
VSRMWSDSGVVMRMCGVVRIMPCARGRRRIAGADRDADLREASPLPRKRSRSSRAGARGCAECRC